MTTDFDYDEDHRQSLAEWEAERRGNAQRAWRNRVPDVQRKRGPLDPRVSGWVDELVHGTAGPLILLGPIGVGKTWHAWHGIDAAYTRGWNGTVRFYSAYQWKRITTPRPDMDEVALATEADVLVWDDPGALRVGEWDKEHLLGVLDERWNGGRPTVLTSNAASLGDMLGGRSASRLSDDATVITLAGTDKRKPR